jgi:very-short-patch-repair endonuclease
VPYSPHALARLIRARKLGITFRRQVVVGEQFIADFLAPSVRLIVEVSARLTSTPSPLSSTLLSR